MPTSNSTGEFIYTATSQGIHPGTDEQLTQSTNLSVAGNQIIPINDGTQGLLARTSIQVVQRSSALFSSLAATFPNNIDVINTRLAEFIMSTGNSPNFSENINALNPFAFAAFVPFNSARLTGFSFQFFGGYQPFEAPVNFTVNVTVQRFNGVNGDGNWTRVGLLSISFTALSVPGGILDGTLAYIPFNRIITTPTLANNLTYNLIIPWGFTSALQPGDFVFVGITGNNPMLSRVMPGVGSASLKGSLLFNTVTYISTNPTNTLFGPTELIIAANSSATVFNASNMNGRSNDIILMDVRISGIAINDTLPPPTFANPHMITINITVRNVNNDSIYRNEMTIAICGMSTSAVVVPFDMPVRGSMYSREFETSNFYYVESINPWFNSNHFISIDRTLGLATFSYPRIIQCLGGGPFTYQVSINTNGRPIRIFNTGNIGTNIMCQLNWVECF
jgi:hypothetical protein